MHYTANQFSVALVLTTSSSNTNNFGCGDLAEALPLKYLTVVKMMLLRRRSLLNTHLGQMIIKPLWSDAQPLQDTQVHLHCIVWVFTFHLPGQPSDSCGGTFKRIIMNEAASGKCKASVFVFKN